MNTIKTKEDYQNVMNCWYNRTIRLRTIADDPNESVSRIKKAMFLYWQMIPRTIYLMTMSIQLGISNDLQFQNGTKPKKPCPVTPA